MTTTLLEVPPKAKHTLYSIQGDMDALDSLLMEIGGDLTDEEIDAAVNAWIEENEANLANKAQGYAQLIKDKEARAAARKAAAAELSKSAQVEENGAKRLKTRMLTFMVERGITTMDAGIYSMKVTNNGGVQPVTLLEQDATKLPDRFQRIIVEADVAALRDALLSDDAEAATVAVLEPRGQHLRIK